MRFISRETYIFYIRIFSHGRETLKEGLHVQILNPLMSSQSSLMFLQSLSQLLHWCLYSTFSSLSSTLPKLVLKGNFINEMKIFNIYNDTVSALCFEVLRKLVCFMARYFIFTTLQHSPNFSVLGYLESLSAYGIQSQ